MFDTIVKRHGSSFYRVIRVTADLRSHVDWVCSVSSTLVHRSQQSHTLYTEAISQPWRLEACGSALGYCGFLREVVQPKRN